MQFIAWATQAVAGDRDAAIDGSPYREIASVWPDWRNRSAKSPTPISGNAGAVFACERTPKSQKRTSNRSEWLVFAAVIATITNFACRTSLGIFNRYELDV
jgi:hypothetical protein